MRKYSICNVLNPTATTLGTNMDLQSDEGTEYVNAIEQLVQNKKF